nr:hypothetical protein [Shuttle vector PCM28]DAZ21803.1 MAG TPA: hypothetical protein [Caudoviricetes sp.]
MKKVFILQLQIHILLFLNRLLLFRFFIPIALLTLSLGTLNNPKTCRMVGLIAHAMPTFVCKFS